MEQDLLIPDNEKIEKIFFTIEKDMTGRLDALLHERFVNYSRSYLQKLIKEGSVLIDNKKITKTSTKLKEKQKITIYLPQLVSLKLKPEPIPLDIMYEDEDLAIINKQSNIAIHPAEGKITGTLVNGLLFHFKNLSTCNGILRPGIVHRLDRNTSGVLIVAKNNDAHNLICEQFKNRKVKKEYLALVEGNLSCEKGTIALPIGMDTKNRRRMSIVHGGKKAATDYLRIAKYPNFSLVRLFPMTGRTHQLRIHLKSQGNPIVADEMYGAKPKLEVGQFCNELPDQSIKDMKKDTILMDRTALHAWQINFIHPTTYKAMSFFAPFPKDFAMTLKFLQNFWPCSAVSQILNNNQDKTI